MAICNYMRLQVANDSSKKGTSSNANNITKKEQKMKTSTEITIKKKKEMQCIRQLENKLIHCHRANNKKKDNAGGHIDLASLPI